MKRSFEETGQSIKRRKPAIPKAAGQMAELLCRHLSQCQQTKPRSEFDVPAFGGPDTSAILDIAFPGSNTKYLGPTLGSEQVCTIASARAFCADICGLAPTIDEFVRFVQLANDAAFLLHENKRIDVEIAAMIHQQRQNYINDRRDLFSAPHVWQSQLSPDERAKQLKAELCQTLHNIASDIIRISNQ